MTIDATKNNQQNRCDCVESLAAQVEALKLQLSVLQAAKPSSYNNNATPSDRDLLTLNVGGSQIEILRGTLTAIPGLLATRFSGEWDENLLRDAMGRFFLDEDPELFGELVKYLREYNRMLALECRELDSPCFKDLGKEKRFHRMIESFHMTTHVYPVELWKYGLDSVGEPFASIAGDLYDIPQVDQESGSFRYILQAQGAHKRRVKSFEIQIECEDCERLIVGWIDRVCPATGAIDTSFRASLWMFLDILKSIIDVKEHESQGGARTKMDVTLASSTLLLIRCADFGKEWYVNGELLTTVKTPNKEHLEYLQPLVSIRGASSFQITNVELEL